MRVVRLMDEPNWQSRLSPIEESFFATSPSAKTLRPDERQPFKERWLGRYIAYDGYYASFAPLCDPYPCHLHINLDERYRNRGIGSARRPRARDVRASTS